MMAIQKLMEALPIAESKLPNNPRKSKIEIIPKINTLNVL
jgi:hypothetical protein